ncbi:MAG: hypothetical protein IKI40_10080 [Treponema sp.]|nr:hypothetical protein [Treponema sp.]
MTVYSWPEGVPTKCFGVTDSLDDNRVVTKSESGIVLSYSRNTFTPRVWKLSIHMTRPQYELLIAWYRNVLGGGSGWFRYTDLAKLDGTMATYMMDSVPVPNGTQKYIDVDFEFREVPA